MGNGGNVKKMYCTPFEFSSVRLGGGSMLEKITIRAGWGETLFKGPAGLGV